MKIIQFQDFSVFYKVKREYYVALDKVDLDVESGEFLAIIGPSGCGKTTLLRSVMGRSENTTGKLLLGGREIGTVDVSRENMGYVSQEYNLYPSMTVYENIGYPLKVMGTGSDEIERRVKETAEKMGLSWLLTRKPRQLSGGQQQRVALARMLVKDPRLILLDEPFSNLAPQMREEMAELLKAYHREQRPTILFVTHRVGEALAMADRVAVMEAGKILRVIPPEELNGLVEQEALPEGIKA